jgi:hypothetical protein
MGADKPNFENGMFQVCLRNRAMSCGSFGPDGLRRNEEAERKPAKPFGAGNFREKARPDSG